MKNLIRFLRTDEIIQYFLMYCLLLFAIGYILIGIPLFILGVWQVFSGFVTWFATKSKAHRNYLIGSISYSTGLYIFSSYGVRISGGFETFSIIVLVGVIPVAIAVWYLNLTRKTLKMLEENRVIEYEYGAFDNVLDSDEILHNNINTKL
ncbi:MAG: hypothetical protein AAF573_18875 [Bacteroidota bacterium]